MSNEKTQNETKMFGCTIEEMREDFAIFNPVGDPLAMQMRAQGLVSDVQEILRRDAVDFELVRQMLNQSKFWMSEVKTIIRQNM